MKKYLFILASVLLTSFLFSSCSRSDLDILGDVKTAVVYAHPQVTVKVSNGIVTLQGTVESEDVKTKIPDLVKEIDGVKSINNEISVVVPQPKVSQDDVLGTAVTVALEAAGIKGISVNVKNEEVTLTGTASKADKKKVTDVMKTIKAKKIINEIK